MFDFKGTRFHWLGHDGFKVSSGGKTIYIDPYQLSSAQHNKNDADIVLISHDHFDHLSAGDLKHVVGKKTSIVAAKECLNKLGGINALETHGVAPGDKISVQGVTVEVVAAYNTNKKFHPKSDRKVGFVFTVSGMRIYHAGDTDEIPEMNDLNPHVAMVPVSGTYVMTAEEAAGAVNKRIKPKDLAIPMHYGTIVGTEEDARKFKELVKVCKVQILERT
jgi:L-ascorbate metabolism protein UlaG (beta-lactamase superfamily)